MRNHLLSAVALLAMTSPTLATKPVAATGWTLFTGLATDPDVRFGRLPNGLRYAIRRNATPPGNASIRLRIDTGSLNERDDQRGIAHFIEHMVFNGSKDVPEGEFVKRLERHGLKFGPDTNASTDFEQTVYKLDLPTTDAETVDTGLFLLRQVGDKALFTAAAVDRERGIILSEERSRATPQLRQLIDELAFDYPGQPLPNRLPIGLTTIIKTAPRDRLVQFYEAYYRPERATIVAVGDFDVAAMEQRIVKQFGDWKGEGAPGPVGDRGSVAQRGREAGLFVDPAVPTRAGLTWLRPADLSADSREARARDMIDALAFAVLNRRLERIAASQSPSPFIAAQAGENQIADTAEATQMIAIAQPAQWKPALAAIDAEQRRLVQFGVAKSELDREIANTRTALQAAVAGAGTRPSAALADGLIDAFNDSRTPTTPALRLALFEEVAKGLTPALLNQSLPRLFSGSGPLVYLTSPTAVVGGKGAVLAAYEGMTKLAVTAPTQAATKAWPYAASGTPGAVVERKTIPAIGVTTVRFANGVRLTIKPTDFARDQIYVQARIGDGRLMLPRDRPPIDWAIGPAFPLAGLKKISAEEMNAALTGRTYGAAFDIDDDVFTLSGATRPADLATQLQVLNAYVAEPGWQATGWDRLRGLSGAIQDQLASTPGGVFSREGNRLLHDGDPRWRTPTRAEMAASSIADAKAQLIEPLAAAPIELVVVGDVTPDEAVRQVAATFGTLPARRSADAATGSMHFPAATPVPVTLTHKGRADQAIAMIAWPTHGAYRDLHDTRVLNVLGAVFQLRLTERIRETEGISYSPVAAHDASNVWDDYGYLFGRVEAPPATLPKFLTEAQGIADDLQSKPVTADELNRALKPLVERLEREHNGNGWWLGQIPGIATRPRVLDAITTQLAEYRGISPAMLQGAAKRYLRPATAYKLVVVPEKPAP